MAKKKRNKYAWGGFKSLGITDDNGNISNNAGGIINAGATLAGGILNPSGNNTMLGDSMKSIGNVASAIPGIGGIIGAGVNLGGSLVNTLFGSKLNDQFIDQIENLADQQSGYYSNAFTTDQLLNDWGSFNLLDNVSKSQVGSEGLFSNKATNKTKELNSLIDSANNRAIGSFQNTSKNINKQGQLRSLANYSAFGGSLGGAIDYELATRDLNNKQLDVMSKLRIPSMPNSFEVPEFGVDFYAEGGGLSREKNYGSKKKPYPSVSSGDFAGPNRSYPIPTKADARDALRLAGLHGKESVRRKVLARYPSLKAFGGELFEEAIDNSYIPLANMAADGGGIHIKKKNRGKFTEYCGGKVTSECIARGKRSSNPTTRKRATFAANARKWNAFGGWLNTQGGDFTNGVTFIDEGGSHEENPYEGIQIGVDPQGKPNLVEEGEVIYNDYVFSDRIKIPDEIRKEYKLKGKTFARAAKSAQRESSERPNDPLSKAGLEAAMERIASAQEEVKSKKEAYREGNKYPSMFAYGGDTDPYGLALENPMTVEELEAMMNGEAPEGNTDNGGDSRKRQTWTRYAPIIGSGVASLTDMFNTPDYSDINTIGDVDLSAETVGYTPVGNYLSYNPLDRDFYINKLNQQTAATRRGLVNTSGGNRASAQAGLLASDYNYGQNIGNLARQAEEYNQQLRERVEAFNRGTNMFNTETGLKAGMFNAESKNAAKRARLGQATTVAQMRQAIKDQDTARRSANITNFLQGLGDMGWENEQRNWLDTLAKSGVLKMNTKGEYTGGTKAKGGKIKTRKKKGLTYG